MLWIGPQLGAVERACIRSVIRQGHPVTLYCYDRPEGIPEGVSVEDAASVLPRDSIIKHSSGGVALFSDRFRFEAQRRGLGIWFDCDTYLLAPVLDSSDYVMGFDGCGYIGAGILRLPPNSPVAERNPRVFRRTASAILATATREDRCICALAAHGAIRNHKDAMGYLRTSGANGGDAPVRS